VKVNEALIVILLLIGCVAVEPPPDCVREDDPLVEFYRKLPTLTPEELDLPENQRKVAECIILAKKTDRPVLLRYLCDPDATEYLLTKAADFDSHLASHLVTDLSDDARARVALASSCPTTRIVAALSIRGASMRRVVIVQSKDTAVRNAYAETLDESEVELLTLLTKDSDKTVARRAVNRLRR